MIISGGAILAPERSSIYLLIGGCLRAVLERVTDTFAGGAVLDLDYETLTRNYSKVFYYDALPERKSGEDETTYYGRIAPQRCLFDRLSLTLANSHRLRGMRNIGSLSMIS